LADIMNRNYHFLKSLQSLDMDVLRDERLLTEEGSSNMQADELLLSDPKEGPMTQKEEYLRYRIDIGRWTCMHTLNLHFFSQSPTSCGTFKAPCRSKFTSFHGVVSH
jgi:hypothetical protein